MTTAQRSVQKLLEQAARPFLVLENAVSYFTATCENLPTCGHPHMSGGRAGGNRGDGSESAGTRWPH